MTLECPYKLVVTGSACTGKTSFIRRFAEDEFDPEEPVTDCLKVYKKAVVINSTKINLEVWDTISVEKYGNINRYFYHGCTGAMVLFNVNCRKSYEDVSYFISELREFADPACFIHLVAAMCDDDEDSIYPRAVSSEEAIEYCLEQGILYTEISSKNNINIKECFRLVAGEIKLERTLEKLH